MTGDAPQGHGTSARYRRGCRCDACHEAKRARDRADKQASRTPEHGTANRYKNFGCRCDACRAAKAQAFADYRTRKKKPQLDLAGVAPVALLRDPGDRWRDHAACKGLDPELFYGEDHTTAKQVCATCPVNSQCLDFAVDNHEDYGVWGGATVNDRKYIRRAGGGITIDPTKCGSEYNYKLHRWRNEPVCDACRAANTVRRKARHERAVARMFGTETVTPRDVP